MRFHSCNGFTAVIALLLANNAAWGSLLTIGVDGINSQGLTLANGTTPLTGAGIEIGQVEDSRPASSAVPDTAANPNVNPASVALQAGASVTANANLDAPFGHPTQVASVMISTDTTDSSMPANGDAPRGVAINANLHASAYVTAGTNPGYRDAILTMQYVAGISDVRAINHSWGKPRVAPTDLLNGNSQLTLGFDWIAKQFDVLQVISGNQGNMIPVPKDNFNGMTIGRSSRIGSVYRQVSTGNTYTEDAEGDRTSIALIAPGDAVEVGGFNGAESTVNGSSFAAPHVTGTVALLQQYAEDRITNVGAPRWNNTAVRHEVMKAVLITRLISSLMMAP